MGGGESVEQGKDIPSLKSKSALATLEHQAVCRYQHGNIPDHVWNSLPFPPKEPPPMNLQEMKLGECRSIPMSELSVDMDTFEMFVSKDCRVYHLLEQLGGESVLVSREMEGFHVILPQEEIPLPLRYFSASDNPPSSSSLIPVIVHVLVGSPPSSPSLTGLLSHEIKSRKACTPQSASHPLIGLSPPTWCPPFVGQLMKESLIEEFGWSTCQMWIIEYCHVHQVCAELILSFLHDGQEKKQTSPLSYLINPTDIVRTQDGALWIRRDCILYSFAPSTLRTVVLFVDKGCMTIQLSYKDAIWIQNCPQLVLKDHPLYCPIHRVVFTQQR